MQRTPTFPMKGLISFALTSLFLFFEMGVQVSPNVMSQELMKGLGLDATALSFLASVYFYSYALMMIPVGLFYDRFKLNQVMIAALLILSVGNLLFALSSTFVWLALARLCMGFGSAFAFVGVLCVIKAWFPKQYFSFFVGITQLMAAIGAMIGETPVALLVNEIHWRATSLVFCIASLVLMVLIFLFVRVPKDSNSAHTHNWHEILESIKTVLKNKQSYILAGYAFFCWGPIIIFAGLWGAQYEQIKFDLSVKLTGMLSSVVWIALAITSPVIGKLVAKHFSHRFLMSITVLLGFLMSACLVYWPNLTYAWALFFAVGIGIGAAGQILSFDLVRKNNLSRDFGVATGFNNIGVVFGGVILNPIVGLLLDYYKQHNSTQYTLVAFNHALWLIPACFVMALLFSLLFIEYRDEY